MNIYVLRHGQTDYNVKGQFQGQIDIKMNENGERQTDKAASELSKIDFDVVFCSPLSRTIDTARKITTENIKSDKRIIERSFGRLEGEYSVSNFEENIEKYNIEPINNLISRVNNFLEEILNQYKTKENGGYGV